MLHVLISLCETAPYSERMTYRRTIVEVGYPVKVREDFSVVVAGKRVKWGLRRRLPEEMGEVVVNRAYDNGNPVGFSVRRLPSGTEVVIGEGCLPVGRHRMTLEYDLYPRLRGDTLLINLLNGEVAVPVDYVEVVVVPGREGKVVPLSDSFNLTEVPGFGVLRISGDGPYRGDTVLNVRLKVPKPRVAWELPVLLIVIALLLHAALSPRRA